jgi:hypothetical protein
MVFFLDCHFTHNRMVLSVNAWLQHYRLFVPLQNPVLLTVPLYWQREYICIRRNSISASVDEAKREAQSTLSLCAKAQEAGCVQNR